MTDKKVKIINWINIALTVVALILECLPKSIRYGVLVETPNSIIAVKYEYWSYFGNFLHPTFFMAWIVAICTILTLLLHLITLFKDHKAVCITALVFQVAATFLGFFLYGSLCSIFVFVISEAQIVTLSVKLKIGSWPKKSNAEQS